MNQLQRERFFATLAKHKKNPTTELCYHSTFELLIAVILSAQATDKSVNRATAELFAVANTAETILALGELRLKSYIQSIGLFNSKAKNIIATCALLVQEHQGQVPDKRETLERLPGVGRKTANVVLNTAFGHPVIAVDTHIFRLANRTGIAPGRTPLAVEQKLYKVVPKRYLKDMHHQLILHGRYVCTAHKPKCHECVVNPVCDYPHKENA